MRIRIKTAGWIKQVPGGWCFQGLSLIYSSLFGILRCSEGVTEVTLL